MLIKTLFFLRILKSLTALVILIKNVVFDLKVFFFFYCILLIMFSNILSILQVGNPLVYENSSI
jgi:hypothetical protein